MKKRVVAIVTAFLLLFQTASVYAALDNSIKVSIDGVELVLENDPYVNQEKNRVLVPLRGVFEALDIHVDYNKATSQVIAKTDTVEVVMNLHEDKVLVNGEVVSLDAGTEVFDQRTYVPIRFIAETFGHGVIWNNLTRTVEITTNGAEPFSSNALPILKDQESLLALLSYNTTLENYIYGNRDVNTFDGEVLEEAALSADDTASGAQDASKEYSETNNQVKGVQESDIIKTDGQYIYQVVDGNVLIFDADPDHLQLITSIKSEDFSATEIFLTEDQLVVYGTKNYYTIEPYPLLDDMGDVVKTEDVEYGQNDGDSNIMEDDDIELIEPATDMMILPYYNEDQTYVAVYDLDDISSPVLVEYYAFDGWFLSGRVIGDSLYMATNKNFYIYALDQVRLGEEKVDDADVLPSYTNLLTGEETVLDYEDIAYFPDKVTNQYLITIGMDLTNGDVDVDAYLGYGGTIYVSNDYFYTAVAHYEYNTTDSATFLYEPAYDVNTVIYKFAINDGKMAYEAKGSVTGTLLNQFSMDEYNGNLRVATTTQSFWWEDEESGNHIFVLDDRLKEIGSLEDLAKGERIYSTRFVGDKIYMVTFKQVDPFFVIDASNPTKPEVLGYLKIPGFSTYMHPMDETHILGFGHDTYENEYGNLVNGGFKISLFDVTDFNDPVESDKIIIGTAGTYSELEYNHKALMYTSSQAIMALPISVSEDNTYDTSFIGAYVFNLDTENISIKGRITHHDEDTIKEDPYYNYTYFDWDYNINRILYIGDYLYTFSNNRMMVHRISDLSLVNQIEIK